MKKLKMVPFFIYIVITLFLMLLLTQTGQSYAWIKQGSCYGSGCYTSGKRPGNFFEAAFAYDDTLVGFILLMFALLFIVISLIVVIISLARKKEDSKKMLIYNIIFSAVYFLLGLTMSIFMADNCYIDDGAGVPTFAFLSTFSTLPLLVISVILLKKPKAEAEPVVNEEEVHEE